MREVEPAEVLEALSERGVDLFGVGDVARDRQRANRLGDRMNRIAVDVEGTHVHSLVDESPDRRATHARPRPGHECDPSL